MDSIPPISSGSLAIARTGRTPVERLERVSRERDRPAKDDRQRERRESPTGAGPEPGGEDDDGRPHVDVLA
ncbi:MAG TPA: hypothetical protein VN845_03895 [Solirubrobacteraceae bacterium]|nr:hypothetical protein [Solirubrobacteraceae bacterium]